MASQDENPARPFLRRVRLEHFQDLRRPNQQSLPDSAQVRLGRRPGQAGDKIAGTTVASVVMPPVGPHCGI
jgi:hypothetical protein